jgi:cystathionine gamma-synthase
LLAHYNELAWAADCGVEANLVRVWVGQDPPEHLLRVFGAALDKAAAAAEEEAVERHKFTGAC